MKHLGDLLERTRREHAGAWKAGLFIFLGCAVLANLLLGPPTPEYRLDAYPGFWAVFGIGSTVIMVWVMKKIIQPLIKRPEENDDE